jgi:N5-(carboxyethyl)ornithine synthase
MLQKSQIIFGWIHATQNRDITDKIVDNGLTAYAWELMYEQGRHIFWRNNELAGEAAVMHAFQCYGKMPYETKVAVLGRGNTARGAIKILNMLGADVTQYDRRTEALFQSEISQYDVVVNCVLWDVKRTDHIIFAKDLKRMKKNALIIDVSCDRHGGVETSIPTTIENPTYVVDGILHYVVDHTPALFYKTFTYNNSEVICCYINQFIQEKPSKILMDALIIDNGNILDEDIIRFQNR